MEPGGREVAHYIGAALALIVRGRHAHIEQLGTFEHHVVCAPIRRSAATSQAGTRLRLLTLCDGHGPDPEPRAGRSLWPPTFGEPGPGASHNQGSDTPRIVRHRSPRTRGSSRLTSRYEYPVAFVAEGADF